MIHEQEIKFQVRKHEGITHPPVAFVTEGIIVNFYLFA